MRGGGKGELGYYPPSSSTSSQVAGAAAPRGTSQQHETAQPQQKDGWRRLGEDDTRRR